MAVDSTSGANTLREMEEKRLRSVRVAKERALQRERLVGYPETSVEIRRFQQLALRWNVIEKKLFDNRKEPRERTAMRNAARILISHDETS